MNELQFRSDQPEVEEKGSAQQMLIFNLKQEVFGLDIAPIKEIIEFGKITPVPMAPNYIRGVINIRGAVVPVLDLSARFGWEASGITKRSCIVIIEVQQDQSSLNIGLMIDSVSEVIEVPGEEIKAAPALGTKIDNAFIAGMVKLDDEFIILLSPDHILTAGQLDQFSTVAEQAIA